VIDEKEQKKDQRPATKSGGTTTELIVSTVAGLVSGLVASGDAIRSEFLEEVKMRSGLADFTIPEAEAQRFLDKGFRPLDKPTIDGKEHIKLEGLVNRHARELTEANVRHLGRPTNWFENAIEIRGMKKAYAQKSAQFILEEYGEHVSGWRGLLKGTFRQFPVSLGDKTRNQVMFKGITFATIIGVGVYNLLTSIATRKKAREIEDLILDKVLEEPAMKMEAAHRALHAEPSSKVSQVERKERLNAAKEPEVAVRA
jgi:hypothetical protein